MSMQTQTAQWPPSIGDYARVRQDDLLGEVIETEGHGQQRRYILALFACWPGAPISYRLDELEPVWPLDP
jgi:hypothetical protein